MANMAVDQQKRIQLLILGRVIIAFLILGSAVLLEKGNAAFIASLSPSYIYGVMGAALLLSMLYLLLLHTIRSAAFNVYLQASVDVILITVLVYATGGIRSNYGALYPLVIIYSVLFLYRSGGGIIASASSIFYGLLMDFEYYGLIHPPSVSAAQESQYGAGYVFSRIAIHIFLFT
ncbi:MAG: hypothetical protein PHY31_09570 [Smithellaceae bacterium]|nr:hypothetical protein [Smithellaceae bacterium]